MPALSVLTLPNTSLFCSNTATHLKRSGAVFMRRVLLAAGWSESSVGWRPSAVLVHVGSFANGRPRCCYWRVGFGMPLADAPGCRGGKIGRLKICAKAEWDAVRHVRRVTSRSTPAAE